MEANRIIISLLALVFSVTIHEVAHGYLAFLRGDPTAKLMGRLTLNPLKHLHPIGSFLMPLLLYLAGLPIIGYARPVPVNFSRLKNFKQDGMLVSAAGPLSNFAMAVFFGFLLQGLLALKLIAPSYVGLLFFELGLFCAYGVVINAYLGLFNLIPVPPLDGGRIATFSLPPKESLRFQKAAPYFMAGLLLLIFTGYGSFLFDLLDTLTLPLIRFSLGKEGLAFFVQYIMA